MLKVWQKMKSRIEMIKREFLKVIDFLHFKIYQLARKIYKWQESINRWDYWSEALYFMAVNRGRYSIMVGRGLKLSKCNATDGC